MEKEKIFHFIYLSFATDQFYANTDVEDILKKSQKNNSELGVTGILLKRAGIFLQLLEGDKDVVLSLFQKIENDSRHRNSKILVQSEGNERIFPNWNMSYKSLEDSDVVKLKRILPWEDLIKSAENGEEVPEERVKDIVKTFALEI